MSAVIIDRRLNPKGKKPLVNRQRYLDRVRQKVREAVRGTVRDRSVSDQSGSTVTVRDDGTEEPSFEFDRSTGQWDFVLPGNEEFVAGDTLHRPRGGSGNGKKGGSKGRGESEDEFYFALSYEEYFDLVFDDLTLPNMIKRSVKQAVATQRQRAGHTTTGMPSNLNVERTAIAGIARRMALRAPKLSRAEAFEEERDALDPEQDGERIAALDAEIATLRRRASTVAFLDDVDLRFNNFIKTPKPVTKAVMFCILDVSASMGEWEKNIAKRFFILLYAFLKRRYRDIEVVFIRHHHEAFECTEWEFFNDRASGSTVVSSAFEVMKNIINSRISVSDTNIYAAHASDGDNDSDDSPVLESLLGQLVPMMQFMAYTEIKNRLGDFYIRRDTELWESYGKMADRFGNLFRRPIGDETEVVSVFRSMFANHLQEKDAA